ncbi:MAG: trans-sulfuration enzyme family protein [Silvanigrellaceae bacterium]
MNKSTGNSTSLEKCAVETILQHAGAQHRVGDGLVGALEQSVTFSTSSVDDLPVYSRLSNTSNHKEICALVAALHRTSSAQVFASGMAAIHAVLTSILRPGDHLLMQENCYGTAQGLAQKILGRWGIETTLAPLSEWHKALKTNTRALFFESISKPFCMPQDFALALEAKARSGAMLICDNTFASPANCTPALEGVDVVVESGTKYMNGHSDLVCGVVACSDEFSEQLATTAMYVGGFLSPAGCMQLLRGLRTLQVRMRAHNENGVEFARQVRELDGVAEVFHGSLLNPKGNDVFRGYSGMVGVRFDPSVDVPALMRQLKLVSDVPSLGGTETTACMPWWTTNRWMSDAEKSRLKIDEKLVRFSIGLESVNDLISDLRAAIACQKLNRAGVKP